MLGEALHHFAQRTPVLECELMASTHDLLADCSMLPSPPLACPPTQVHTMRLLLLQGLCAALLAGPPRVPSSQTAATSPARRQLRGSATCWLLA